jgi:hypothetical protein
MRTTDLLATVPLLLLGATGCNNDPCSKTYERMQACAPAEAKDSMPQKDEFIKSCKEEMEKATDEDKKYSEQAGACADKTDCAEYRSCLDELSKQRTLDSIKDAMSSKAYDDALMDCRIADEMHKDDQDIQKACVELRGAALEAMMVEVTKIRDAGEDSISKCVDLEGVAEKVSEEAKTKATALCEEAKAAERAKEAKEESKANVAAKKGDIPIACSLAMEDLSKLESPWAKATQKDVATACYLELGKLILPAKVPEMKYVCDYHVKAVYEAVKAHELADPELDPWIEKASTLCDKEE